MGVRYLLGIDAGQTVTKAVLFDATGTAVAAGRAGTEVSSPRPRWQERGMADTWRQTAAAIRACLTAAAVPPESVAAVGICAHSDGVYPVDADGNPVRAAILATDSRAHEYTASYRAGPVAEEALRITGTYPFAGSPAAVVPWLRDHEPSTLHAARWLLFCKDWLRLCLTGTVGTDPTDAAASFAGVHTQEYSPEALSLFGVEGYAEKLPLIEGSASIAGHVTDEAAARTGLVAGTPVIAGAHDVDAAALGVGAVAPDAVSVIMGTFAINQVVGTDVRLDGRWQTRAFLPPRAGSSGTDAKRWLHMSTSPSSASNLDWAVRILGPFDAKGRPDFAAAVAEASEVDAAEAPLFLPFLYGSPHGEAIGASFAGVRGWHSRAHLLYAVLEGVVFNHRTHLDALASRFPMDGPVRLCGGGATSPWWSRLMADAIGAPVEVTDTSEAGARGAAVLAGLGIGWWESLEDAAKATVRVTREHRPSPAPVLDERYGRYLKTVEALRA